MITASGIRYPGRPNSSRQHNQRGLMFRRAAAAVALAFVTPSTARATWSVIAVDMSTGRVVIASATCVNRDDAFLMGIQAVVVPGKGVAACQAGVDNTHTNQKLVFAELQKGTAPDAHHRTLIAGSGVSDPAVRHPRSHRTQRRPLRADERLRHAGHPGPRAGHADLLLDSGQHSSARRSRAERGRRHFSRRNGAITDRVMAAMEAADAIGRRQPVHVPATAGRRPAPAIPCDGEDGARRVHPHGRARTTRTASSHNNGKYAMYLTVTQPESGGPNAIQGRRESESGEDAAHALRRVAQDAAGVVPMRRRRCER